MSLVKFPPSNMAASSSVSEKNPLLRHTSKSQENLVSPSTGSVFPLFCVIGAVLLERISYYGILANLVLFLNSDLLFESSDAISIVLVFAGMAWFMSTVGGFIGDAVSGRYNAIWGSLLIYIVGVSVLPITAYLHLHPKLRLHTDATKTLVCLSLFIISIGEGAYKANISAFGAEQVEGHDNNIYRKYFNWYYWSINFGSFVAYSGIAYLQLKVNFFDGFLVSFCCILLATVVFCCGRNFYVINSPTGYFKKVYQIIKEARSRKRQDSSPSYPGLEDYVPRKSWLDRAMMKYGGSYLDCEVEEVKILGKIIVVFIVLIPYWTIYYQMNTTFLVQGVHMKIRHNNDSSTDEFVLPPSWLSLIDVIIVLILIPIVDRIVYPCIDRQGWNLSVVRRISIGFLFAVLSMVIAGLVESKRWQSHGTFIQTIGNKTYFASDYPIFYQIPQYAFIGISEVFASVGGLEFAYRYAPKHMQGFVMGLFYLVQSAGSWVGVGLFVTWKAIQHPPSSSTGQDKDMDKDKGKDMDMNMKYYFFLLAGVMFVTWLIFVVVSRRCALPLHYRKKVAFTVKQKCTGRNQKTLKQAPLVSTDLQSGMC